MGSLCLCSPGLSREALVARIWQRISASGPLLTGIASRDEIELIAVAEQPLTDVEGATEGW